VKVCSTYAAIPEVELPESGVGGEARAGTGVFRGQSKLVTGVGPDG